jgi:glutamate formiminotransferase/formiminotetrahydrofolate cyclodeaminase
VLLQGAALGSMVGFLTYGNKKFADLDSRIRKLIPPLYKGMKDLIPFVDADAAAFSEFMLAMKLPKATEEERKLRDEAMKQGMLTAIQVPMCVAQIANEMWPYMKELAQVGNLNCKSDLQTGARILETGVWGAYYNVLTNLDQITDANFSAKVKNDIEQAVTKAQKEREEVLKILEQRKA